MIEETNQLDNTAGIIHFWKSTVIALKNITHRCLYLYIIYILQFYILIGVTKERRRLKEFYALKYTEAIIKISFNTENYLTKSGLICSGGKYFYTEVTFKQVKFIFKVDSDK